MFNNCIFLSYVIYIIISITFVYILIFYRECFVRVDDAQSVRSFVHAASRCHAQLQYATINDELWGLHIFNLTKAYMAMPNHQIKTLAKCVGQQPGFKIWVLNKSLQLTKEGTFILQSDQAFYWYGIIGAY